MIKKGDNVIVLAGKDKGKSGKVLKYVSGTDRVLVEGVNILKKHIKAKRSGEKGQVVNHPMPIHRSNVMILEGGTRVRIGSKKVGDKRVRISRKSGKEV